MPKWACRASGGLIDASRLTRVHSVVRRRTVFGDSAASFVGVEVALACLQSQVLGHKAAELVDKFVGFRA
jgi:hypothetical protein